MVARRHPARSAFGRFLAERFSRYVGTEDGPFIVFRRQRFVSWLSDEFLRNRYDQLVRELIAAEGLWTDKPATNFSRWWTASKRGPPNPERLRASRGRSLASASIVPSVTITLSKRNKPTFKDRLLLRPGQARLHRHHDGDGEFIVDNRPGTAT